MDTSPKTMPRAACSGDGGIHNVVEFVSVMRSGAGCVFTNLRPNHLGRVQLGSAGGKLVDMESWMTVNKHLHAGATMDRMFIPHQNDGAGNLLQQMDQKRFHFFSRDGSTMPLEVQADFTPSRRHTQAADQVEPVMMIQTGVLGGRLPAQCPGALQRRDRRKPRFIEKKQPRLEINPLFLSVAKRSVSNAQSLAHCAPGSAAGAFDYSSPCAASSTKHCSYDTGSQLVPRSHGQYDPGSNSLLHSRWHTLHASALWPTAAALPQIKDSAAPGASATCAWMTWSYATLGAIDLRFAALHRLVAQPRWSSVLVAVDPRRALGDVLLVPMFQRVSSSYYRTQ
jgi:hypothetical protein